MKNRCILIFPKIENMGAIHAIREKYDPAANKVAPHITLVFPFESSIRKSDLKEHMIKVLSNVKPFKVTLSGITGDELFGKFLFLNVKRGKKAITDLHKRLYTGILKEFLPVWIENGPFLPHMTVGKIDDREEFEAALNETKAMTECFEATVRTISVEIIEENGDSTIEMEVDLKK